MLGWPRQLHAADSRKLSDKAGTGVILDDATRYLYKRNLAPRTGRLRIFEIPIRRQSANMFTFIHQKAGSNNRKPKKDKRSKKSNTKT